MIRADPYYDLLFGVQALRRQVGRFRCPTLGALGIRAQLFPHQVANVHRILTDIGVRHLLADEVGLGKTVQALMVINALRLDQPQLRVLILVPDELVTQWRDELLTRAHQAPIEFLPDEDSERFVRLAWPAKMRLPTEIDAAHYDLLVVDELHRLRSDLQQRVVDQAPEFNGVLVLTATPRFQEPRRHAQLLQLLEPDRVLLADREGIAREASSDGPVQEERFAPAILALKEQDVRAAELLSDVKDAGWDALGGPPPADQPKAAACLAHCMYRRGIRTRRADFPGLLPRREYCSFVVEPTAAEVKRQRLMWRFLSTLSADSPTNPALLGRRALLGQQSLRPRVRELRRLGRDPDDLLRDVEPLLGPDHGDSRLDELVDLLAEIWRQDPRERVLVVAHDNPTVDHLYRAIPARLPRVGPRASRKPLVAARVRGQTEAVGDLGAYQDEADENLTLFETGEALVLFAADIAQVGLNLQCARLLVLYSIPWEPQEVEQWIGRLDRIGNSAIRVNKEVRPVEVFTIVQRGMVDASIAAVLDHFRVFSHGVNLDGGNLERLSGLLRQAALSPHEVNWADLEETAARMAEDDRSQEFTSPLRPLGPWDAAFACRLAERVQGQPVLEPSLLRDGPMPTDAVARDEREVEAWLKLLDSRCEYEIRTARDGDDPSFRFQTLWYRFEMSMARMPPPRSQVTLGDALEAEPHQSSHARNRAAFITRRAGLRQPPRRDVLLMPERERRELQFVSHGSRLHEELVEGWLRHGMAGPDYIRITRSKRGAQSPGIYVLTVAYADPASLLAGPDVEGVSKCVRYARRSEVLLQLAQPRVLELQSAHRADARWLRSLLQAQLVVVGQHLDRPSRSWKAVPESDALDLLALHADPNGAVGAAAELPNALARVRAELRPILLKMAEERVAGAWLSHLPTLRREVALRRYLCTVDRHDRCALRNRDAESARQRLSDVEPTSPEFVLFSARAEQAEDIARMAEHICDDRLRWIDGVLERMKRPSVETYRTVVLELTDGR